MTKVSREEVLKIARMSNLGIAENEIQSMIEQLEQVLSYAQRVTEVASTLEEPTVRAINVFREDVVITKDPELILAQAPEREGNFFVVPAILENK
jgi:aspartyl-tRNA(Asn)/glutamyl-tRNA(Gln) amidotransferase subunit C